MSRKPRAAMTPDEIERARKRRRDQWHALTPAEKLADTRARSARARATPERAEALRASQRVANMAPGELVRWRQRMRVNSAAYRARKKAKLGEVSKP